MLSAGGGWGVSVGGMWGGRGDSEMEEKEGLVVKEKDTSSPSSSTGVRAVLKEEYSSERVRGGIRRRRSKSLPHRPTGGHSRLLLLIFVTGSRRENVSKDEEKRGKVKLLPPYRRLLPFLQDSPAAFSADRKCPVFQTSVVLGG